MTINYLEILYLHENILPWMTEMLFFLIDYGKILNEKNNNFYFSVSITYHGQQHQCRNNAHGYVAEQL